MRWKSNQRCHGIVIRILGYVLTIMTTIPVFSADSFRPIYGHERQVTRGPGGRILTNTGVWSPDSQWLVYDIRSDPAGDVFDGTRIEAVRVDTGEVKILYQSVNNAHCGVATHHPHRSLVVFILGPENPTADWSYGPNHRQGVVVNTRQPGVFSRLDARDLVPPFTPGALRGGSHVHVWDAAGDWLAFTYNDALVEPGLRDIGVAIPDHRVQVKPGHPRNHDADWYCGLVTRTVPSPQPGSDEIKRANEEGWIGNAGYVRIDGSQQRRAIAFQGHVVTESGTDASEVFIVDLPDELSPDALRHAQLSPTGRIEPLPGSRQRRLTRTTDRRYPGIQGTRHWLRSSPDGSRIAFLMKDDSGVSQIWTVSPATGETKQLTRNLSDVSSAMSWSSNGRWIAHGLGGRVCLSDTSTGATVPITSRGDIVESGKVGDMRKEACVISPDGCKIAFVRSSVDATATTNQICVIQLETNISDL
jgi:Tol biopolymer transport system component